MSRNDRIEGVPNFTDIDAFLAEGPAAAVALCVPPGVRTAMALKALGAGRDVLLEKPPAATLGEVEAMAAAARAGGRVLFATWHSRFAHAVAPARAWLDGAAVRSAQIVLEGGRAALASGAGLDLAAGRLRGLRPGINALSILTEILPGAFMLREATLTFPENRDTPIAATLAMTGAAGFPVTAEFDWRQQGPQSWDITVETDGGRLELRHGGALDAGRRRRGRRAAPTASTEHLPPLRRPARAPRERRRREPAAHLRRRLPHGQARVHRAVPRLTPGRREQPRSGADWGCQVRYK